MVTWDQPPLLLELGHTTLDVDGRAVTLRAQARVYAFGVICLLLQWPLHDVPWTQVTAQAQALDRAADAAAGGAPWLPLLDDVCAALGDALQRPQRAQVQEDYLLVRIWRWREPQDGATLAQRLDVPALLAGEHEALAESTRRELLRHSHAWYADELLALTWDRALIVDPRADADTDDASAMLELANAQLLELRWYDAMLDEEWPRMQALVAGTRRPLVAFLPGRMARLARRMQVQVTEVNELIERVEGTLQSTGDTWLARVHGSARDALGVPALAAALERKLALMRETYRGLYEEAAGLRATLLEATIVALIVIELLLALWRH